MKCSGNCLFNNVFYVNLSTVMSKSSEEVLLIVNHVRYKKCDGSMYMMSQRMAWMPTNKSAFTVSHNYADIKGEC